MGIWCLLGMWILGGGRLDSEWGWGYVTGLSRLCLREPQGLGYAEKGSRYIVVEDVALPFLQSR